MWMLSIFYFLVILLACASGQNFISNDNIGKVIIFIFLIVGFALKRKIQSWNSAFISLILFFLFAFYSAFRGIDAHYSVPLLFGFLLLYLFVKANVESLSEKAIKDTLIKHSYIANILIIATLLASIFFPTLVNYQPANFHPYSGLTRVTGTSSDLLLGAFLLNIIVFFIYKGWLRVISLIFGLLAVIEIAMINARTADLSILLFLFIGYLVFIVQFPERNFGQSVFKFLILFAPFVVLISGIMYLMGHLHQNFIVFHQTGDTKGFDLDGRAILWVGTLKSFIASEYVLRGVGFGNQFYFLELNLLNYLTMHNVILDIMFSTGLIGVALFLCFIVFSILNVFKNVLISKKYIHLAIFAGLIMLFFQSQGESSFISLMTTHLYLYFLLYEISMRFIKIKRA